MASTVFQTWPCQTWPCQLPGGNVVASPNIPSLPAHWYAATSVKATAPSKTSAEITGRLSSPARRPCPDPVHATTAGKFKLRHYRIWARSAACRRREGYCCAREPTQGWAVRGNYERRAHRQSKKALARLIEQRRAFVKVLAGPYERGKTEQARERFLEMQTTIEAMNRAIEDEERSQGSVHGP